MNRKVKRGHESRGEDRKIDAFEMAESPIKPTPPFLSVSP